ncbi:MAG: hypothetical protein MN733_41700 [Nitrososphaera sp.]|nr:hypothetical protein [Nitrososphaera sp.]
MSDFAFFRFLTSGLLTDEEKQDKETIVMLTEDVLHAQGMECDSKIAKISEEELAEILEKVRLLRKRRKGELVAASTEVIEHHYG